MLVIAILIGTFPPIGIISLLIYMFAKDHRRLTETIYAKIIALAIGFIAIMAPIVTAISIFSDGLVETFNSFGVGVAITIFEIHVLLYILWKTKISMRLNVDNKSHKSICKNNTTMFVIGVFCFVILLFGLLVADGVNIFFPALLFMYGFAFFFWDITAQ